MARSDVPPEAMFDVPPEECFHPNAFPTMCERLTRGFVVVFVVCLGGGCLLHRLMPETQRLIGFDAGETLWRLAAGESFLI